MTGLDVRLILAAAAAEQAQRARGAWWQRLLSGWWQRAWPAFQANGDVSC